MYSSLPTPMADPTSDHGPLMSLDPDDDFPNSAKRPIRALAKQPIRLLTRARLLLLGHEELTGLVSWAALTGFLGALASVLFREGIRLFEWLLTGQTAGLVGAASELQGWHRAITPMVGGVAGCETQRSSRNVTNRSNARGLFASVAACLLHLILVNINKQPALAGDML